MTSTADIEPVPLHIAVKNKTDREVLTSLCKDYRALIADEKRILSDKATTMEAITEIATELKLVKVDGPGWRLTKTTWTNRTIKSELLLSAGVSLKQIDEATAVKTGHRYGVTKRKG